MFDASSFSLALGELLTWQNLLLMLFGTFFGIFCGAMPGLSSTMALTIMVPFTFSMSGYAGILACWVSSAAAFTAVPSPRS